MHKLSFPTWAVSQCDDRRYKIIRRLCLLQTEPYTMLVKDSEQKTGNDRYEGYNIDLIHSISKILGFNYSIRIVADGNYGSYSAKTQTWNGMIGELLSQVSFQLL